MSYIVFKGQVGHHDFGSSLAFYPTLGWPLGYLYIFPNWFHKDPIYYFSKGSKGQPRTVFCASSCMLILSIGPYTACNPKFGGAPAPPLACENNCLSKRRGGCMGFQDISMKPYQTSLYTLFANMFSFSFPFDVPSLGSCSYSYWQ